MKVKSKKLHMEIVMPCLLLLIILWATNIAASPVVIYDSKQAPSIISYYIPFESNENRSANPSFSMATPSNILTIEHLLPYTTPGITPGRVLSKNVNIKYLTRPLFLIGADKFSLEWLSIHKSTLKKIGAVGMLLEANTISQIKRVAEVADGLQITPAPATDIVRLLSINHYPVLITKNKIEQ